MSRNMTEKRPLEGLRNDLERGGVAHEVSGWMPDGNGTYEYMVSPGVQLRRGMTPEWENPPMQGFVPAAQVEPQSSISGMWPDVMWEKDKWVREEIEQPGQMVLHPGRGFANGGIVGLARGGQVSPIEAYIRQQAAARGMDPEIAVRVARSEGGLNDPFRQGESMLKYGREESYGPFQLHMRNGGVGVRALQAGIDPRKNWQGGVDYALAEAQNKGWGQWFGAAKAGIGKWQGIKNQGGGVYPQGGEPIAYTPTTTAVVATDPNAAVAQTAADTATKMTDAEEGSGMEGISRYYMMQQLMGSMNPQQPQVAPPPQQQQQARAPIDPRQFIQNPYFMQRGTYG
jgi:hypothetical protein